MSSSIAGRGAQIRCPWLFGRYFDLAFFFMPVAFAFLLFQLSHWALVSSSVFWAMVVANALGAGPFHQGATLFTYLDKQNREHYRSEPRQLLTFFAAPPLIMALTIAGAYLCLPLVQAIWLVWSLQHIVKQNVGILLLYHGHGKGEAIVPRPLEERSQYTAACLFGLIFFHRVMLGNPPGWLWQVAIAVALALAARAAIGYLIELRSQIKAGAYLNLPALGFWIISILSLSPIAFLGDSFNESYLIPVTVHWFQYIGLNWRLVRRKYTTEASENLPFSNPARLFLGFCLFVVVGTFALMVLSTSYAAGNWQKTLFVGIILGLGHIHYFLDAFIWRFREPYQRKTVLPYLVSR